MDFAFSDEQQMLREAARGYLAETVPVERVAQLADGAAGWDAASWPRLAELGWLGEDLGFLEQAVLFEETGRALYPGPLWCTLALAGPALPADLRAAVTAGDRSVTLAWAEPAGTGRLSDVEHIQTRASEHDRLTGRKVLVPDLTLVTDVVVTARAAAGIGLYAVELSAIGHGAGGQGAVGKDAVGQDPVDLGNWAAHDEPVVVPRSTSDRTRRLGELVLEATPARLIAGPPVAPLLGNVRRHALAALACEAVGVAERCLAFAADHARQREQFGRLIGSYQAVSHRIADVYVELELARSLAYWATWCVAVDDEQASTACTAAKSAAGAAAVFAAESAIQVLGGIGFSWDHPLHRFYKRAQWIAAFEGSGPDLRAELAADLLR